MRRVARPPGQPGPDAADAAVASRQPAIATVRAGLIVDRLPAMSGERADHGRSPLPRRSSAVRRHRARVALALADDEAPPVAARGPPPVHRLPRSSGRLARGSHPYGLS